MFSAAAPQPDAPMDVTITLRNIGLQDLHKVNVNVSWGVDTKSTPARQQLIVDIPRQGIAEIKLQARFPNGYGFVMAHALTLGEHAPFGTWTPDPTPHDNCALRVVNAQLAPPNYRESLLAAAGQGGCTAK
jgi:hypothetical protein